MDAAARSSIESHHRDSLAVISVLAGQFDPLLATVLTCNTSALTAIGNDCDFTQIFARQVRACAGPGDCVVGISTSGRPANVLEEVRVAREAGSATIGFIGASGHAPATVCDECSMAASSQTPRIQEAHLVAWHLVCELVERGIEDAERT